jgi:hypothetical protein
MFKKEYILTETGEIRCPKEDEYYLNDYGEIEYAIRDIYWGKAKILRLKVKKIKPKQKAVKDE